MATIDSMLRYLNDHEEEVEKFNKNPEHYMREFGLGEADINDTSSYINKNRNKPLRYITDHAPGLKKTPNRWLKRLAC